MNYVRPRRGRLCKTQTPQRFSRGSPFLAPHNPHRMAQARARLSYDGKNNRDNRRLLLRPGNCQPAALQLEGEMRRHSRRHLAKRTDRPQKHDPLRGLTFPAGRSLPLVATNLSGRQHNQPPQRPRR
jgi:hypothetical protein